MGLAGFLKVTTRNPEHAEAFAIFFVEVLVVHLVCLSDGREIRVFRIPEPAEAAVDEDVMHQKVAEAIGGDAGSNP